MELQLNDEAAAAAEFEPAVKHDVAVAARHLRIPRTAKSVLCAHRDEARRTLGCKQKFERLLELNELFEDEGDACIIEQPGVVTLVLLERLLQRAWHPLGRFRRHHYLDARVAHRRGRLPREFQQVRACLDGQVQQQHQRRERGAR